MKLEAIVTALAVVGGGLPATASSAPAAPGTTPPPVAQGAPVRLEYIAHASFLIESPGGTRVVLDPFNGNIWLGYSFPSGLEADAVLVSHPHYDHDATYYFSDATPVLRRPGEYRVGDVGLRGLASEHAGRARFLDRGEAPLNTIWIVEAAGLRIAHLGDNRLLNELDLEAMGPVDVILMNAAYLDPPNAEMLALLLETAAPKVMVPMHYRHDEITELPDGMLPVSDHLRDRPADLFESNVIELSADDVSEAPRIVVLKRSPAVAAWPDWLYEAWVEAAEGAGMLADAEREADGARAEEALWEGLFHYETAMDLAPGVLRFGYGAGQALAALGQVNDAIETLDHALARAPAADWTDRARVHMLLGELYARGDHPEIAIAHYEYVVSQEHTHETSMRSRALQRLEELRQRP